jgi:hypothetical protein
VHAYLVLDRCFPVFCGVTVPFANAQTAAGVAARTQVAIDRGSPRMVLLPNERDDSLIGEDVAD